AFFPDHIELEGENVLERDDPGHAWEAMQVLHTPTTHGKLPRLSAPKLAKAIDPFGQLSDGAVNSCIHTLRSHVAAVMLERANLTVGRDDVIANLGKGYHLAEWLVIESHDAEPAPTLTVSPAASSGAQPRRQGET